MVKKKKKKYLQKEFDRIFYFFLTPFHKWEKKMLLENFFIALRLVPSGKTSFPHQIASHKIKKNHDSKTNISLHFFILGFWY